MGIKALQCQLQWYCRQAMLIKQVHTAKQCHWSLVTFGHQLSGTMCNSATHVFFFRSQRSCHPLQVLDIRLKTGSSRVQMEPLSDASSTENPCQPANQPTSTSKTLWFCRFAQGFQIFEELVQLQLCGLTST